MKKISKTMIILGLCASILSIPGIYSQDTRRWIPGQKKCAESFAGSMLAAGIGDALGRVTEFIDSTEAIFKKYPSGVRTYADFKPQDWDRVPLFLKHHTIAPYTDDTGMARLVMKALIKSKEYEWDLNQTMSAIAESFVNDFYDEYGWALRFRAVGRACCAGTKELEKRLATKKYANLSSTWWDVEAKDAGGCGSVMRSHPFGLIFTNDPEKAALWAAEHSKLTHGHPIALAACAAMATGIAHANQGKTPEYIVEKMVSAARVYDKGTADKIVKAREYAQQAKKLRAQSNSLFEAYKNPAFRQLNDHVFTTFPGWAAHDAIAATVYAFLLSSDNCMEAIYLGVHTPGDSDSIASMVGALVGARLGETALPTELIAKLENSADLKADAVKASNCFYFVN